jgi:hypothetical protein
MNARRAVAILAVLVALAVAPTGARAQIQKSGSQNWPGKVMLGVHPMGVQAWFTDDVAFSGTGLGRARVFGVYKLMVDFSGIIARPGPLTVWLGGGFNIATAGEAGNTLLEPWMFVILSFERLIKIPLVPFVRFGFGGGAIPTDPVAGVVGGKMGFGMHYWLTKNVGLGFETNFFFGGFLFQNNAGNLDSRFAGFWDFGLGARFAF